MVSYDKCLSSSNESDQKIYNLLRVIDLAYLFLESLRIGFLRLFSKPISKGYNFKALYFILSRKFKSIMHFHLLFFTTRERLSNSLLRNRVFRA